MLGSDIAYAMLLRIYGHSDGPRMRPGSAARGALLYGYLGAGNVPLQSRLTLDSRPNSVVSAQTVKIVS